MAARDPLTVPVTSTLPGALHVGMMETCAFAVKLLDIMVGNEEGHPRAEDISNCHVSADTGGRARRVCGVLGEEAAANARPSGRCDHHTCAYDV